MKPHNIRKATIVISARMLKTYTTQAVLCQNIDAIRNFKKKILETEFNIMHRAR